MTAGDSSPSTEPRYPIRVVGHRTAIPAHTLRVWERRYTAVEPARSSSGRRLYSDADVEKLRLLRRATESGWRIGQVAGLEAEELRELLADAADSPEPGDDESGVTGDGPDDAADLVRQCLAAALRIDAPALAETLDRAGLLLGRRRFLDELAAPLLHTVGERWSAGKLRPVQEHLASTSLRRALDLLRSGNAVDPHAPHLLVTTPRGELHEVGALLAAAAAEGEGWRTTYLGPNLPAEEIALAARRLEVDAVALSVVCPSGDLESEISRLHRLAPDGLALLLGGRGADSCADLLDEIGALRLPDLSAFRRALSKLTGAAPPKEKAPEAGAPGAD